MSLRRKIFLNISDIAAFIGQNSYDFVTPFERLWKKYDEQTCISLSNQIKKEIIESNVQLQKLEQEKVKLEELRSTLTKRQYTLRQNKLENSEIELKNRVYEKSTLVQSQTEFIQQQLGESAVSTIQNETIDTQDKRSEISDMIENLKLSPTKKKELRKQTEHVINKTHGTLKENNAIALFEKKLKVKLDTSQKYHHCLFKSTTHFDWHIGGKMDGIYRDPENPSKNYVVEIKNRTKSFFNTLRDYEKTQIQLYIYLTNVNKAKLVECIQDKIRITDIYKDEVYLTDIQSYLTIFIERMDTFIAESSLETKQEYFNSSNDQKKIFLKKLYLNDIYHTSDKLLLERNKNDDCLIDDLD